MGANAISVGCRAFASDHAPIGLTLVLSGKYPQIIWQRYTLSAAAFPGKQKIAMSTPTATPGWPRTKRRP
jgi:hypothetical protein